MTGSGGHPADASGRIGASDCERLRDGWVAQPVNTLTSLGYVAAGCIVLTRCQVADHPEAGMLAGGLALVGIGSVAFHGPQPPGARLMHDLPILAVVGMLAATPLARRIGGRRVAPGWTRRRGLAIAGLAAAAWTAYAAGRTGACCCRPDSPLQAHGAWHLLSAAGFVVMAETLHRPVTR